jgi:hypothetical protein
VDSWFNSTRGRLGALAAPLGYLDIVGTGDGLPKDEIFKKQVLGLWFRTRDPAEREPQRAKEKPNGRCLGFLTSHNRSATMRS